MNIRYINSNMTLSIEKIIKTPIAHSLGTKLKHGNGTSCTNQILYIMQKYSQRVKNIIVIAQLH